ncbi:unnamed protein product [Pseudo-nitzschia multistriata]|uniref:BZIP domain-containing protein n=1 Tax=Pseudo-nitzschia multistriata TaxID=183589 RepID=A0A448ZML4_9STRA|nr:unnamed protein product [Pseudo-nitzschia multistriata]
MTNSNAEQEVGRTGDVVEYPVLVKSTSSQSKTTEGDVTAPNSTSSSPLSFTQTPGLNSSSSHHNISTTTTQESLGAVTSMHDYQQENRNSPPHNQNSSSNNNIDKLSRGPLSPQSAPPSTSIPGAWGSASLGNTPVPSVIHTEAGVEGPAPVAKIKSHGSAPYFPTIDRTTSGNMSMGSASSSGNLLAKKNSATKTTGKKKHQTMKPKKSTSGNTTLTQSITSNNASSSQDARGGAASSTGQKKQRRLERNRLSAQLSRRRRKQYLEELEERVVKLSLDMDSGRRAHAFRAINRISEKRKGALESVESLAKSIEECDPNENDGYGNNKRGMLIGKLEFSLKSLEDTGHLSRVNSKELLILNSFLGQQLKSFSLPSHSKFILWLTLQGDIFYRGGRAASERLSAARIGEKMLANGTDKVTPASAMWPLICNEVGLSYELEERLRVYQRTIILQDKTTWLDRHTARSSALVMQSFHNALGGMAQMVGRRESEMSQNILTPLQRAKFLAWTHKNSSRIKERLEARRKRPLDQQKDAKTVGVEEIDIGSCVDRNYPLKKSHHLAANMYILNHQLQRILKDFPYQSPSILKPSVLKKLMRRASFESLGQQKEGNLPRDDSFISGGSMKSFSSNGSLSKSGSSLSLGGGNDSERPTALNQITPTVGEQAADELVDQAIGFVKAIIPPIPKPTMLMKPNVHASAQNIAGVAGSSQRHDKQVVMDMDYHNHCLVPVPVGSYGAPETSAAVPPSNQHPYQQLSIPVHHNGSHPPPPLNSHNYQAPPQLTYQSPQAPENYHQPPHSQAEHYYPPQQHVHYPPQAMGSHHGEPMTPMDHINHDSIARGFEASSPVVRQDREQQQHEQSAMKGRHVRKSSFLPPHLSVVPEDNTNFTAADFLAVEDCLMDDGDCDWGIGIGVGLDNMDTTE